MRIVERYFTKTVIPVISSQEGQYSLWYVLSCLWDSTYQRSPAVNQKEKQVSFLFIWMVPIQMLNAT